MDDLRVPKRRVEAEVLLAGGATRRVAVFLADTAPGHAGGERLSDLLNGREDFIPAFDVALGAITFLNRTGVILARVDGPVESEREGDVTIPSEHEVEIALLDGSSLRGLVSYILPPDRSRLNDFLNASPPFFRLLEPGAVALVNKRHVARVVPLSR
jgi:hypothetical protein